MNRAAAITHARAGAEKLWAGTVVIHPKAKTGAHHHGPVESVIYVVSGRARMRWGDRLEFIAEAGPGDFIYVPPYVPHQEINASDDEPLSCVLVRSGQEPVVVNLDCPAVEQIRRSALGGQHPSAAGRRNVDVPTDPQALLLEAVAFAAEKHRNQRRKDAEASPYINHPIALANLLKREGVDDVVVLCAALLHDTIEDTKTTPDELRGGSARSSRRSCSK